MMMNSYTKNLKPWLLAAALAVSSCTVTKTSQTVRGGIPWGLPALTELVKYNCEVDRWQVLLAAICYVYIDSRQCAVNESGQLDLNLHAPHPEVGNAVVETLKSMDQNQDGTIQYSEHNRL